MRRMTAFLMVLGSSACTIQTTPPPEDPSTAPPQPAPAPAPAPTPAPADPQPSATELKSQPPVSCSGQQNVLVEAASIESDVAITASGQCVVQIRNSYVKGKRVGIRISGQAQVAIWSSQVEGGQAAVHLSGQGTLETTGTTFRGQVDRSGQSKLVDKGGNAF